MESKAFVTCSGRDLIQLKQTHLVPTPGLLENVKYVLPNIMLKTCWFSLHISGILLLWKNLTKKKEINLG